MQEIYKKDKKIKKLLYFVSQKIVYFIKSVYLCTRYL